jgi:predicted nucleotidyltransferase
MISGAGQMQTADRRTSKDGCCDPGAGSIPLAGASKRVLAAVLASVGTAGAKAAPGLGALGTAGFVKWIAIGAIGAGAMSILEAPRQRFPAGKLAQEREALTIESLARQGQRDPAARRAAAFLQYWPTSPYADVVRVHARTFLERVRGERLARTAAALRVRQIVGEVIRSQPVSERPSRARILGSLANDEFDAARSDIDLMVWTISSDAAQGLMDRVWEAVRRPVHLLRAETAPASLLQRVLDEGVYVDVT